MKIKSFIYSLTLGPSYSCERFKHKYMHAFGDGNLRLYKNTCFVGEVVPITFTFALCLFCFIQIGGMCLDLDFI